eukprot:TRINITY_DN6352_c0_g1_i1.p1 TRINITY_DN6352_c0_g1~~TRINITY_DN6352_c0_g1_i1.p1  ORF type:complete len:1565 (+),score=487.12 TRINITY_DN6352_c0_g1_i1:71-4696(+)
MRFLRLAAAAAALSCGSVGASSGGGAEVEECVCDSITCPYQQYKPSALTWYEANCGELLTASQQECITSAYERAVERRDSTHTGEAHAHAIPYNILVIFGSFGIGAALRFVLLGTQVPYTVVLFLVGMAYGAASLWDKFSLDKYVQIAEIDPHLIFFIFLPALIFESAFAMDIPTFKKVVWQCIIMAGPGLMACSFITGCVAKYVFTKYKWNWYACLLFGTILSATDPVAVVALLKELGASPVISTMIEGESLFNDGTAIVFFSVLAGALKKESCPPVNGTCILDFSVAKTVPLPNGSVYFDWPVGDPYCLCTEVECTMEKTAIGIFLEFCRVAFGGALVGLLVGAITVASLNRVFNDALIEVTLTLVAAYVTFFVAEGMLHVSGVLGVVACGCLMSYYNTCISPDVEHTLHHFWEAATYLANTLIFLLAGLIVSLKAFGAVNGTDFLYLIIIYVTINVARTATLILFMPVLRCFRYKLDLGNAALVAWGGLRGAVGLALALNIQGDEEVAIETVRTKFIFHVSGIVLLTLCVNGVTTSHLVRYFKLNDIPIRRRRMMSKRWGGLRAERELDLEDLRSEPLYYDTNWEELAHAVDLGSAVAETKEDPYNDKGWSAREGLEDDQEATEKKYQEEGRMAYITTCNASVHRQYGQGSVTPLGCRRLHHFVVDCRERGDQAHAEWEVERAIAQDEHRRAAGGAAALRGDAEGVEGDIILMDAEVLRPMFEPGWLMNWFPDNQRFLRDRWQLGFDTSLGFVRCHETIQHRIHALCEPHVANRIATHSKKVVKETVDILEDVAKRHPEISCSIKTRQAARAVLNAMRDHLASMKHEGRLDAQDWAALYGMVDRRIHHLRRMPGELDFPRGEVVLEDCEWYRSAERKCQKALFAAAIEKDALQSVKARTPLFQTIPNPGGGRGSKTANALPGLMLVVVGVVEVRIGRKRFKYGPGHTLGWQQLLTGSRRFSAAYADSKCCVLVLHPQQVVPLVHQFPEFREAAWRACGQTTAQMLIGLDVGEGGQFDQKLWPPRRVRKVADRGAVEILQDPSGYSADHQRKHTLRPNALVVMLRGRAWEFGEEEDHIGKPSMCRFPMLLPTSYKFATFTEHAVLYTIEEDLTPAERARRLWGRLRSKTRSICLWSGLRGPRYKQCSLAWALNRTPPPEPEPDPRDLLRSRQEIAQATLEMMEMQALEGSQDATPRDSPKAGATTGHGAVEVISCNVKERDADRAPKRKPSFRVPDVLDELARQQGQSPARPAASKSAGKPRSRASELAPSPFLRPSYPAVPRLGPASPQHSPQRSAPLSSPLSPPTRGAAGDPASPVVRMRVVAAEGEVDKEQFAGELARHLGLASPAHVEVLGVEGVEGPLPPETDVRFRFTNLGEQGRRLAGDCAQYQKRLPPALVDALQPTAASLEGEGAVSPSPPRKEGIASPTAAASLSPSAASPPRAVTFSAPPPDVAAILTDLDQMEAGSGGGELPLVQYAASPLRAAQPAPRDFAELLGSPVPAPSARKSAAPAALPPPRPAGGGAQKPGGRRPERDVSL